MIFQNNLSSVNHEEDIARVRNKLVDTTLIVLALLSVPPLLASLIEAKTHGWDIAKYSQIGAVVILFFYVALRNMLSFRVKSITTIAIILILGCTSLYTLGIAGSGTLFFMIAVVLATLFFGSIGGKFALAATLIPYIGIVVLFIFEIHTIDIDLDELQADLISWSSDILLFILFAGIVIFTAGRLYKTLNNNITFLNRRNRKLELEIKQRKKAEDELRVAKDEALSAYRAKNEFLANMGHEIRTPLHAITGFSDLVARDIKEEKQLRHLESIKSSSLKLMGMITTILDLSALETGKFETNYEFIDSDDCFQSIVNLYSEKAVEKGIIVLYELQEDFPSFIYLDRARLTTILSNLLDNAIKFTDEGHVKISMDVASRTESDAVDIQISIEDTGIGMPEEFLDKVFIDFVQMDGKANRKYEGTGIGLSFAKKVIEKMNGALRITSKVNEGTRIEVDFSDVKVKYDHQSRSKLKDEHHESNERSLDISAAVAERVLSKTVGSWEKLQNKQPMEEVEAFGKLVKSIGDKENLDFLKEFGEDLCESVDQYDIDRIMKLLRDYSLLIEKLSKK